jgi:hypothetical protein
VPTGLINGTNTVYTTGADFVSGSLVVYRNGIRLKPGGDDYTETTGGFTMVTAPETNSRLLVDYAQSVDEPFDASASLISSEVPTGTINSVNTTFTVQSAKYAAGSLQVFVNGLLQAPTTHYTESDPATGEFVFTDAPETGDNVLCSYQVSNFGTGNADMLDGQHASAFVDTTSTQTLNNKTVPSESYRWVGGVGEPAYQNGWVDYNTEYAGAGFMKDATGVVHLTGLVKSGTINTAIFILPVGYRPAHRQIYTTMSNSAISRFDVVADGQVIPISGSNAWVSLETVSFLAEQ